MLWWFIDVKTMDSRGLVWWGFGYGFFKVLVFGVKVLWWVRKVFFFSLGGFYQWLLRF